MSQARPNVRIDGFSLGPFATNCYVVSAEGSKACWIIDASFDPHEMIDHVQNQDLKPEKILLTHAHVDHIAGLEEVRRAFPEVPVAIHKAESDWLEDPMLNLSQGHGFPITTRPAEQSLSDGDELEIDGVSWRVLHTPGHSPGGVTLYCEDAGVAIVGDTLFAGSIGRFDFPTSNQQDLEASIRERLYALPEETRVLPGHGPETTIGREKRSNPFVRAD